MPDTVKGKKIGDFAWYIDLRSDLGNATILAFKRPESERRVVSAEASLSEAKVGGQYGRETEGNVWDTVIVTKEHGILPIEAWKSQAGLYKIKSAIVSSSGITSVITTEPVVVSAPTGGIYRCPNCGEPIMFTPADGLCPSCGKKFTV
jgi:predicted RNA-binding Zn-ribbon protein involved in translation (DUF1610 family)